MLHFLKRAGFEYSSLSFLQPLSGQKSFGVFLGDQALESLLWCKGLASVARDEW